MILSNRRKFLGGMGAIAAASFPMPALAQAKPKLVVVGGGPGGATIAKYVAKDSSGAIEVTLVEPLRQFTTCFHSNLYLGGFRDLEIDQPFVRRAGVQVRRQARAQSRAEHRSREEDRAPRRRIAALLRPPGGGAGHRHQVRFGAGLLRGGGPRSCRMPGSRGRRPNCSSASSTRSRTAPSSSWWRRPTRTVARPAPTSAHR